MVKTKLRLSFNKRLFTSLNPPLREARGWNPKGLTSVEHSFLFLSPHSFVWTAISTGLVFRGSPRFSGFASPCSDGTAPETTWRHLRKIQTSAVVRRPTSTNIIECVCITHVAPNLFQLPWAFTCVRYTIQNTYLDVTIGPKTFEHAFVLPTRMKLFLHWAHRPYQSHSDH